MKNIHIQYFNFEEDFVEDGVRCIPMIVRFKLDHCGIKLKLSQWSKFSTQERTHLAEYNCFPEIELVNYRHYLEQLILTRTGQPAVTLEIQSNPEWEISDAIPIVLQQKLKEFNWHISLQQWNSLNSLQRFALLKLCRPGHENRNFPIAFTEFGLKQILN